MTRTAIILAGGLGTRLGELTLHRPKPLLPVRGRPFLEHLIGGLVAQGIRQIIIAAGFQSEQLKVFAHQLQVSAEIIVSVETEPLGTGGAIVRAFSLVKPSECDVLVLNGDSYSGFDLDELVAFHRRKNSDVSLVLKSVEDGERYGLVELDDDGRVAGFREKGCAAAGFINGGTYLIRRGVFTENVYPAKFSFEREVLETSPAELNLYGLVCPGYFIDIGIPADYKRAERELPILKIDY